MFARTILALGVGLAVSTGAFAADTLKIGVILPYSGPFADAANQLQAGIDLYMQPKIRVADGAVVGAETLIRWRQETGRLVLPSEFVPLAEHSGSIVPLTWVVFDKLAELVKGWPVMSEQYKIAVNVAPRVFDHADFPARLEQLRSQLASNGIGLIVELTEESLISDYQSALTRLHRVRRAGVELSIDDFGKGYSSLN